MLCVLQVQSTGEQITNTIGNWVLMEGIVLCVLQVQSAGEQSISWYLGSDGRHFVVCTTGTKCR